MADSASTIMNILRVATTMSIKSYIPACWNLKTLRIQEVNQSKSEYTSNRRILIRGALCDKMPLAFNVFGPIYTGLNSKVAHTGW